MLKPHYGHSVIPNLDLGRINTSQFPQDISQEGVSESPVVYPMHSYPDVLKEPRPHHIGGMLRKDASLVLGGAIFLMQDAEILIQLQLKLSYN